MSEATGLCASSLRALRLTLGIAALLGTQSAGATTLVAHWDFSETSGVTVADSAGVAQNGTVNGGVNLSVSGPTGFGSAAHFDGSSTTPITINGETLQGLFGGSADFSISGWFLTMTTRNNMYAFGGAGNGDFQFVTSGGREKLEVHRRLLSIQTRTVAIPEWGSWMHVALVNNSSGVTQYYVNGILRGNEISQPHNSGLNTLPIIGGGGLSTREYLGYIDELKVWGGALTPAEVASQFAIVPEPTTAALLAVGLVGLSLRSRRGRRN